MPGEKTEKATAKRREDERKKGNIFMSKDVTTAVGIVVSFFTLRFFVFRFINQAQNFYLMQMDRATRLYSETLTSADMMLMLREALIVIATTVLPVMIIVGLVTILVVGLQTRWLFTTEQIKFKLERISPLKGIKKLFSLRSIVELLKSLVKIIILVWILYGRVMESIEILPRIIDWEILQAASYVGRQITALVISVTIAFGIISILDYLYQRYEYEKGIRMSKQEIKDEYKQLEGNPEVKSKRREKQREYAMGRMMQQVQQADVVVRNPTHYAVALKYELNVDAAPTVLAKGADNIALKIIEEAEKHGVSTVENKPLARSLYELADIDDVIPAELFQPVAELLAWLYSQKEKGNQKL